MVQEKFLVNEVKDVIPLIDSLNSFSDEEKKDFKLKLFSKKSDETACYVLSRKAFNKYCDKHSAHIVGRIRKRQRKYKDVSIEDKNKKNIIGRINKQVKQADKDFYTYEDAPDIFKSYDLRESKNRCVWGYGWLGGNEFVEITRFNPLIIFIPLLITILICAVFASCPKDPADVLDIIDGEDKTTTVADSDVPEYPNVYVVAFPETTELTADSKSIQLWNLHYNYGNYYVRYDIYVNGEKVNEVSNEYNTYKGEVISADETEDKYVDYNLYDMLDAGTYDLELVLTSYDWDLYTEAQNASTKSKQEKLVNEARRPNSTTLTTTLVVSK